MKVNRWLGALLALCLAAAPAVARERFVGHKLDRLNRRLGGTVVEYTHHHGADHRIWSPALCQKRDLYVYLPPGFDPERQYPVMLWLHGFLQDENAFLNHIVEPLDRAMRCGKLPPMIVAAPDGTIKGRVSFLTFNSFFLNTKAGKFEDYIIEDIWNFLVENYPIRPEREAHVLAGISMGGFAAFNQSIKHRDNFKVAIGIYPPLNLRWVNCHGRYMRNFDPSCWGWREQVDRGYEVIGRFYGVGVIRLKQLIDPLFGRGPEAIARIIQENPAEMIDHHNIQPGDLEMYVAYGGKDEFNLDAQVESFLYLAKERGLCVGVGYDPRGRHNMITAVKLLPGVIDWLAPRMEPFRVPECDKMTR